MQLVNERRTEARAPLTGGVVLFMGDDRLSSLAVDISASGMAVAAPIRKPIGGFVRLNFSLDIGVERQVWHDADGVITRVAGQGGGYLWGIHFVAIAEPVLQQVQRYVQHARWVQARQRQAKLYGGKVQDGMAALSKVENGFGLAPAANQPGPQAAIRSGGTHPWLPTAPGVPPMPAPVSASASVKTVKLATPSPVAAKPRPTPGYRAGDERWQKTDPRAPLGTGRMDSEFLELYQAALDELDAPAAKKRR